MLSIALPKGRLGNSVYKLFAGIGYECAAYATNNRKLVLEDEAAGVRYFLVKPGDVAIYVERGAADLGVAGKDILIESEPDVYELLDLNLGKCRACVAAPEGFADDSAARLRVATKYVNIARKYYASRGRDIEIIKLNGSVEIAPLLGLSDVIVDLVETGSTLRENNLRVTADIMDISARLIANKAAYKFKAAQFDNLTAKLREVLA